LYEFHAKEGGMNRLGSCGQHDKRPGYYQNASDDGYNRGGVARPQAEEGDPALPYARPDYVAEVGYQASYHDQREDQLPIYLRPKMRHTATLLFL